ncbi:MAG: COQ9 family protein [Pseudomonadota bacterium]
MSEETKSETDRLDEARAALVEAALPHVAFDGWTRATMKAAAADAGVAEDIAALAAPRGGVDLAAAFHRMGDARMISQAAAMDLEALRYSERVARLVKLRIEVVGEDREAVRRGATLFSLPIHGPEGARLIWGTADAIWNALGDASRDYNWYTKRAILSGVYSSTVLYWLGDQSPEAEATWAFLDRRIENVMQFEKTKAKFKDNKLAGALFAGPKAVLGLIKAPGERAPNVPVGFPGRRR